MRRPLHRFVIALWLTWSMGCAPSGAGDAGQGDHEVTRCRDQRSWGSYLKQDTSAAVRELDAILDRAGIQLSDAQRSQFRESARSLLKWRLIRFLLVEGENHNFGAVDLTSVTTHDGKPVRLYRSGFTPRPEQRSSCFQDLLHNGGVRHVVSLYAGDMPTRDLEAAEQSAARAAGATYFSVRDAPAALSSWRSDIKERGDDPAIVRQAMTAVATLINDQILRPEGRKPQGNIHVHCAGGMHRTSMIVGILERCLNRRPMDRIEADYRRHVGWQSEASPGGYEPGNLAFIREFDCSLLAP